MSALGHAGYPSRPIHPDDPLVCNACGLTIGTLRLEEPEHADMLKKVLYQHLPDCTSRQSHMKQHRTLDRPCPRCGVKQNA